MKLLFDQNLSFKLCARLADLFPGSQQVRECQLDQADDRTIWKYAKQNGFAVVSQNVDFADLSAVLGSPPKVLWLRCGNQPTTVVENLLRKFAPEIAAFESDASSDCLQIQ